MKNPAGVQGGLTWTSSILEVNNDIVDALKQIQTCSSFDSQIYGKLRAAEDIMRRPQYNYMLSIQQEINPHLRAKFVNWLVQKKEEYQIAHDAIYMTVRIIDMYLSVMSIEERSFQLLGTTCMYMAMKCHNDIKTPTPERSGNYSEAVDKKPDEVLKLETEIMKILGTDIVAPTAYTFLKKFILLARDSEEWQGPDRVEVFNRCECLAKYLTELSLTDYGCLRFAPSVIAASAIFLARWTLTRSDPIWTAALESHTKYKPSHLQDTVLLLQHLHLNTYSCLADAIRKKYSESKYLEVAKMISPKLQDIQFFTLVNLGDLMLPPNMDNLLMGEIRQCPSFDHEMYENDRASEVLRRPQHNYMTTVQLEINQAMRAQLVDWIVQGPSIYLFVQTRLSVQFAALIYISIKRTSREEDFNCLALLA